MKKIFFCLLVVCNVWAAGVQDIESCIQLARKNYPLHQNTELLNQALALSLQKMNLSFLPHLRFNSKVSYQSDVTTLPFTPPTPMNSDYSPLRKDQYQFALEISQPVLDFGNLAQQEMTKAQYATQKAENSINLYKVQQSVINVYFAILLLEEQIHQNTLHIKELRKNLKTLQVLYKNGAIEKEALSKIDIEILKFQKIAQELKSEKEVALHTLSLLTATEINANPITPSFDEQKAFLRSVQHYAKKETIQSNTLDARPENTYFALKHQEIQTQKKLENAKSLPYLDLFVQGGYANPSLNFLDGSFSSYYITGLRVNWDFSNLYSTHQQNELIRNQQLRLNAQKEEFTLNTKIALNKHIKNAFSLLEQMQEDEKIVRLQTKILKSQEAKLKNGILSINDFITDINNLNLAKLQRNYTKMEFLMQVYNIKQILNVWRLEE